MIVDYFPPEYRTSANALYASGLPIGSAICSLSAFFVSLMGWRGVFKLVGIYGSIVVLLQLIFLREPIRSRFEPKVEY